jgi:Holliday junction resolvase-like predicted endonuclease
LKDTIEEKNVIEKGEKFERFFENFMEQQEGFIFIDKHCRSKVGEIDYFYRNELESHPIWRQYDYLFVECKNWQDKIGSEEMDHFIRLLEAKTTFKCCGIYLTTSSFSPEALTTVRDARMKQGLLIIPFDRKDLFELIRKSFKDFVQETCDRILAKS